MRPGPDLNFASRLEKLEFERLFSGGDLEIDGDGVEYVDG